MSTLVWEMENMMTTATLNNDLNIQVPPVTLSLLGDLRHLQVLKMTKFTTN